MRTLTSHKINPANDCLEINAVDEPGSGGAHHCYAITGFDYQSNPSVPEGIRAFELADEDTAFILFQNGPIAEVGVNGLTHEAILAIVEDRLASFQEGPYANVYNAEALGHIKAALKALHRRTQERMERGVEGTHTV